MNTRVIAPWITEPAVIKQIVASEVIGHPGLDHERRAMYHWAIENNMMGILTDAVVGMVWQNNLEEIAGRPQFEHWLRFQVPKKAGVYTEIVKYRDFFKLPNIEIHFTPYLYNNKEGLISFLSNYFPEHTDFCPKLAKKFGSVEDIMAGKWFLDEQIGKILSKADEIFKEFPEAVIFFDDTTMYED
jgi:hypothetical protein